MSEEIIVFLVTGKNMGNHSLAIIPTAALDVSSTESAQQQLGLVEPRGARRRAARARSGDGVKEGHGS